MQFQKPGLFLDSLDDLIGVIDQARPPLSDGPMTPGAGSRVHPPGNRENLTPIVFGRQTRRDHGTAPKARLKDDHAERETGDDPIPLWETAGPRSGVARIFAQDGAARLRDRVEE